jgi:hypothetical protein
MDKVLKFILGDEANKPLSKEDKKIAEKALEPHFYTLEELTASFPGLERKTLRVSKKALEKTIKWGSSRYIERKSWVVGSILENFYAGQYIKKDYVSGSTVERHGLGSWHYTLLIDREGKSWLIDPHVGKAIWELVD